MKKTLGIDIGGSNIKFVLMGERLERSTVIKTPRTKSAFFKTLEKVLFDFPLTNLRGIGVCVPGLIDRKTGVVLGAPNLPFLVGSDLKRFMSKINRKVVFDNDVKCILLAEHTLGAARGFKDVVLIAIGTGIGGGLLMNGEIYRGAGHAGEIGHVVMDNGKTFEQLASGKSLRTHSALEFARAGKYIGIMCANVINLLNPQAIVLSGGVGANEIKNYRKYLKPQLERYVKGWKVRRTKILIGELGEIAGAIGAGLLFR